jgi:2-hydroxy-6-oxonona-2,4-dienedioate hydrolase
MTNKLFQSAEAQAKLEAWYDTFLAKVDAPCGHREVQTTWGKSHVLVAGYPSRPPLVCLHGSMASSAHILPEMERLLTHYELYLPDVPGQSAKGLPIHLPLKDLSHAQWLTEVLDGLELEQTPLLGISWGGFVALQTALFAPQRINKLVLMVPAGIVNGSIWKGITQAMIPMMRYKRKPTEDNLRVIMGALFTNWSDDWAQYFGDALRGFVMKWEFPPLFKESSHSFTTPTLVFGAEHDLSFPGEKLLSRLKQIIPHAETELIPNSKHSPPMTPEFRAWIASRVVTFLTQAAP